MAGNGLSERLQTPISTAELERRWNAVRAAMTREGVDVLLMQNNNDHRGRRKWLASAPPVKKASTAISDGSCRSASPEIP